MRTSQHTAEPPPLSALREPGTLGAILAGSMASTLGVLFSLVVLLGNWIEPECTLPEPIMDNAAYCAINCDDYTRTLFPAALTLLFIVFTAWVCVRVVRRHRAVYGSAHRVWWQVSLLVAAPVLTIFLVLAVVAAPLLRGSL